MAYTKAKEALRIATEKYEMSYEDIAGLCNVSLGTVKRWMTNGRADEKAIRPLINKIGSVYLSASQVADHLEQLYGAGSRENRKGAKVHRFRITNSQLHKISGRARLKPAFMNELIEEMDRRGRLFLEGADGFIIDKIFTANLQTKLMSTKKIKIGEFKCFIDP
jgi:hypothetical protein